MSDIVAEFPHLKALDPVALVNRGEEIKQKLRNMNPNEAPEEDQIPLLRELSCIAGILRGRTMTPTAAPKKKAAKRITPTLDSIL